MHYFSNRKALKESRDLDHARNYANFSFSV